MAAKHPVSPTTRRTQRKLIDATRAEIARDGSFGAERVALRAGTSVATFYQYFPSKRDALAAAFDDLMEDLDAFVAEQVQLEALVDEGLEGFSRGFVAAGVRFFSEHALLFRCALAELPGDRALRRVYRDQERRTLERIRQFVERGQRTGLVRRGDPNTLARGFLVLAQGLNNPLLLRGPDRAPVLRELARGLYGFLAPDASGAGGARKRSPRS
ncbi:MAG: TetR/AcrR family transcriptional regulator [Myxococcota bacterium]